LGGLLVFRGLLRPFDSCSSWRHWSASWGPPCCSLFPYLPSQVGELVNLFSGYWQTGGRHPYSNPSFLMDPLIIYHSLAYIFILMGILFFKMCPQVCQYIGRKNKLKFNFILRLFLKNNLSKKIHLDLSVVNTLWRANPRPCKCYSSIDTLMKWLCFHPKILLQTNAKIRANKETSFVLR